MYALTMIRDRLRVCRKLHKDYHLKSQSHQRKGNNWTAGFCFGVAHTLNMERLRLGQLYKQIRKEATP